MIIKPSVKENLLKPEVIGELMIAFRKSYFTIKRWLDEGNEKLTTIKALDILKKVTGLERDDIFIEEHEITN